MTTCSNTIGSCGTSSAGTITLVQNAAPRPAFMVPFRGSLSYPAGSTVYTQADFWVASQQEDRTPGCGPSSWRRMDMKAIMLRLQRLGDCQADFFFPPMVAPQVADLCDEAPMQQVWNLGQVATYQGKLYTPKRNGVTAFPPVAADWCGGYTSAEVMAWVLQKMCAEDAGNLG